MKTFIKPLISSALAIVLAITAVFASNPAQINPVINGQNVKFNRISVIGNVEILLIQGNHSSVAYSEDNTGKVRITEQSGKLSIEGYNANTAKLTIYVNDLFRIQVSKDAVVKTQGNLKVKYLQLFLKDNSSAQIKSQTDGLYTVIEDKANLELSGSTTEHALVMGNTPKLTMDKFAALKIKTISFHEHNLAFLSK